MAGRLRGGAALAALGEVRLSDEEELSLRLREQRRAVSAFLGESERARTGTGRGFWLGLAVSLIVLLVLGVVGVVEVTWAKQQQQQRQQQQQQHAGAVLPQLPSASVTVSWTGGR